MLRYPIIAFALERADRGGRGVKDRDAQPVDRLPEAPEVGIVWNAVEHHARSAHRERAVDDISVTGNPADVGGAPEDVVRFVIENPLEGRSGPGRVTAGGVDDALRLPRRARRVEDE